MNGATANPVAELAIIARHIRTDGPGIGWQQAEDQHPILRFPLLGRIPRRLAENQIGATIDSMASTVEYLTYNAQLQVDRGQFQPIAVSEDAYLAVKARARQLASGVSYSMFANAQMVPLWNSEGTTNCSRAAADLLAGGTSDFGPVPYIGLGVTRGFSSSSAAASYYQTHGPSYQLHPYVTKQYSLGDYSISNQLKRAGEARSCSCKNVMDVSGANVCKIGLGSGGTYTASGSCTDSCSVQGSALPLLAANCTAVDIQ